MRMRVGLGPVFAYEWLATSRRWQVYAMRSLFVTVLLTSLALVGTTTATAPLRRPTIQRQAEVGRAFYQAIVGTQLILLLLAAPAATAGSVCLDKARGTLTHLLLTDLSNAEIVLGKLAARLIPVLGLVASALPALALGTLMGGIDPRALTGAFLVSLGVAILGCTLALLLSVWGTKTHEVLIATYVIFLVWIVGAPTWSYLKWVLGWGFGPPQWLNWVNPFWLTFASSWQRGTVDLGPSLLFLAASCGISAVLTAVAVVRVRDVASRQAGHAPRRRWWFSSSGHGRWRRDWFGPRLDPNPILWREWHRRRPSRWSRILWTLYNGGAIAISLMMVALILRGTSTQSQSSAFFNGGQVAVGFLLLSILSSTSLTEERVRGSLDVLLATPMSTRAIVLGKWWGAYQSTLLLVILPGMVTVAIAYRHGHWEAVPLVIGLLLTFGAALTSLGLALATWIPHQGRVMALTVTAYVFATIGWPFVMELLSTGTNGSARLGIGSASPWLGTVIPNLLVQILNSDNEWSEFAAWLIVWCVVYSLIAIGLLAATLGTFDRCLGRVSIRSAANPPRPRPKPKWEPAALMD
ncbi:ABC transporter permease subunit [Singulisphaera sp. Ch08]|uniref:ABC transporter permease subunit n=1 Tax=Singulisphaera sp. Ch08 TaxID=3120278 RepID=A0AAU7CN68_9BACT